MNDLRVPDNRPPPQRMRGVADTAVAALAVLALALLVGGPLAFTGWAAWQGWPGWTFVGLVVSLFVVGALATGGDQ